MRKPWRFVTKLISKKSAANRVESRTAPAGADDTEFDPTTEGVLLEPPSASIGGDSAKSASDATEPLVAVTGDYELEESPAQNDALEERLLNPENGSEDLATNEVTAHWPAASAPESEAVDDVVAPDDFVENLQRSEVSEEVGVAERSVVEGRPNQKSPSRNRTALPKNVEDRSGIYSAAPVKPRSMSDEIKEVDLEIQELRARLAEKLRSQNRQLNQMLRRFTAS